MFCHRCGKTLTAGNPRYCFHCGAEVPSQSSTSIGDAEDGVHASDDGGNPTGRSDEGRRNGLAPGSPLPTRASGSTESGTQRSNRRRLLTISLILLASLGVIGAVWLSRSGTTSGKQEALEAGPSTVSLKGEEPAASPSALAPAQMSPPASAPAAASAVTKTNASEGVNVAADAPEDVPQLPDAVDGYTLRAPKARAQERLFAGASFTPLPPLDKASAESCEDLPIWVLRWASQNPDVEVAAAILDTGAPDSPTLGREASGTFGYLSGSSCVSPGLRFSSALRGNASNLVDVDYEYQLWDPTASSSPGTDGSASPCGTAGDCKVGDIGPAGGIIFLDAGSQRPWGRYLEAAPAGWFGTVGDPQDQWCDKPTKKVPDAEGAAIGSGAANTQSIVEVCSSGAAVTASKYTGGGERDWYLPSQDELDAMYERRDLIGGFASDYYWSSTREPDSGTAVQTDLSPGYGYQYGATGYTLAFVRPIRAF